MFSVLNVSDAVRAADPLNVAAFERGEGLPPFAECATCGHKVTIAGAELHSVSLALVQVGLVCITLFGHADHFESRVMTPEQLEEMGAPPKSNPPVPSIGETMFVDGKRIG